MIAGAVALACAAIAASPIAASADDTSAVGWVRIAQLSPAMKPVDGYVSPAGGAHTQPVLANAAYGTMSQYRPLAPGNYTVAMRDAGSAATSNALATAQVTVAAGQLYTVASVGTATGTTTAKLQVLSDELAAPADKVGVRVIEASRLSPTASVMLGNATLATNLRSPNVSPYQMVDPGTSALLITTKAATTQTISVDLVANSTYSVVILDGTEDVARVLVVEDASGMSAMPKGGVSTGFGGTAAAGADSNSAVQKHGYGAPLAELLAVFSMLGLNATIRFRRRRQQRAAELREAERIRDATQLSVALMSHSSTQYGDLE